MKYVVLKEKNKIVYYTNNNINGGTLKALNYRISFKNEIVVYCFSLLEARLAFIRHCFWFRHKNYRVYSIKNETKLTKSLLDNSLKIEDIINGNV